jgi:hypothetical protein
MAATETIPTPMRIEGFEISMEGKAGGAAVRVKDARRGFARWVTINGIGRQGCRSGAYIYARSASPSVDRARAYATTFARVLKHNGIACEVDSWLD